MGDLLLKAERFVAGQMGLPSYSEKVLLDLVNAVRASNHGNDIKIIYDTDDKSKIYVIPVDNGTTLNDSLKVIFE